jgi:hypothetical protein
MDAARALADATLLKPVLKLSLLQVVKTLLERGG